MRLRDVELSDVDAYVKMRCDPAMMAELGGPQPRDGIEDKVRRDVQDATSDTAWIKMIVPDEAAPGVVAGTVTLWSHHANSEHISEIGWMVLPEFQGRGLGKLAVRTLLELARDQHRTRTRFDDVQGPNATAIEHARVIKLSHQAQQCVETADFFCGLLCSPVAQHRKRELYNLGKVP